MCSYPSAVEWMFDSKRPFTVSTWRRISKDDAYIRFCPSSFFDNHCGPGGHSLHKAPSAEPGSTTLGSSSKPDEEYRRSTTFRNWQLEQGHECRFESAARRRKESSGKHHGFRGS